MIFIWKQVVEKLQSGLTFPKVAVKEFYSATQVVTPMVTVSESAGTPTSYPDGKPANPQNIFQIEVYCKQQAVNGKTLTAIQAANELCMEVNEILTSHFGLTQAGNTEFLPYESDQTVIRGVTRYYGIINEGTEIIYR